ncbi:MAG: hypothetical protein B7Y41_15945 [Hydrogenophilales bacterium 28-61-23]|nr:MAG: hypothetical protein B7Y41_15945 [Hydrogenophilales bacterium 28-61-23]
MHDLGQRRRKPIGSAGNRSPLIGVRLCFQRGEEKLARKPVAMTHSGRTLACRAVRLAAVPLLIGLSLLFPLAVFADDIVLGMTKGEVHVLPAGRTAPVPAGKGLALRSGDRVYTGQDGWATLLVPDGSRVVLTADSEFMVRAHDSKRRTGAFALITGMLRAIIAPSLKSQANSPPHYRFNTSTAVAGVRGTDFSMIHFGQANIFFGNQGTVEVQGIDTAARLLTAASVVQTTRGLLPTQPIPVDPDSRLAEAQALLNSVTEQAPASWAEAGKLPEIVAQWNLTYSRHLADAGRQDEALLVLQVALDLTEAIKVKARSTEKDRLEAFQAQLEETRLNQERQVAAQAAAESVRKLYADFTEAYQAKALGRLTRLLVRDWKAGDGADVSDLEDNLSNSFRVFDRIQYAIGNLNISPLDAGRFQVSYTVTITGQIQGMNMKHQESSNVTDTVVLTPDGPKIQSTRGGKPWLQ